MRTPFLLFLLLFSMLSPAAICQEKAPSFQLHKRIGVQVGFPRNLAVDSEGNIYLSEHSIIKFHPSGYVYHDYPLENLKWDQYGAFEIAIDQEDNLYIISYTYSKIAKYTKAGELVFEAGSEGSGPGQFRYPEGIAVNSKGEIFIGDVGNNRIQIFDNAGNYLRSISATSSGLAFDAADNLYASSTKRIQKYSPSGELLLEFGNTGPENTRLQGPDKIAIDKNTGQVYVSDFGLDGFFIYDTAGNFERSVKHVDRPGRLYGTYRGIAIDPDGNVVISDSRHHGDSQVILFSKTGEVLNQWGYRWRTEEQAIDGKGNVYLLDQEGKITKFDKNGDVLFEFRSTDPVYSILAPKGIATDLWGNVYVLNSSGSYSITAIFKFNKDGKLLNRYTDFGESPSGKEFSDITVDAAGNIYVSDFYGGTIIKINPSGKFERTIGTWGYDDGKIWLPVAVAVDMLGILHVLDYKGGRVQQFDPSGKFIRAFGKYRREDATVDSDSDMALDEKGNIYIAYNLFKHYFWIYNAKGELLHEEERGIAHVSVDRAGSKLILDEGKSDAFSIYLSTDYKKPQSTIQGIVYSDNNRDCALNEADKPIPGIVIAATPGPYYAVTREDGSYTLAVDPGTYTLKTAVPTVKGRTITPACPTQEQGHPVTVTREGEVIHNIDFANGVSLSPYLTASVSSTRRRRCFESTTKLTYSNTGFAPAEDAKVYLQLPEQVELLSADKAYIRLANGTYVFEAGTVVPGQTGVITIQDKVICGDESIRGLTVCTKAWITPGNQSPTAPPTAVSSVTGRCDAATGYVRFVIRNNGQLDMETGEQFRIYQDGRLATIENYKLAAGDSMVFRIPAMGRTIRLEADQPEGSGDNILASATVEGCGAEGSPVVFSTGFVNAMPTDDEEAEVAEECLLITDSFDPNDKLVMPTGLPEENFTPTGVALKYKIRFQNTGTDVAYRVVVVDTLSEHLDISTLQIGSTSHNHTYEVSGNGRPVLTWTFNNIMLPDSTANEPGSHGYVQFSIKPKADLPEKTAVENFADIFFDYNSPVRTNVTVNRIYDMPLQVLEENRIIANEVVMTPTITAFSPASGKYGTEVLLTGLKFSSEPQQNKVYLNGVRAEVLEGSATTLKVRVPVGASTGTISVVTEHAGTRSAAPFIVYQPPVIAGFSPAEGVVGAEVTLQGNYLAADLVERVQLGSLDCEVLSTDQNTVTVRVPADAATGAFTVHTKGGTVQSLATYRVWYAPTITGFDKVMERVGGRLLLQGENFAPEPNRNTVLFGNVQAEVLQATAQTLEVRVPAGAQSGTVSLTTPGGTAYRAFEVILAPVITAVYPAKGSVGTVVELQGEHFLTLGTQDTVFFSGVEAIVLNSSSTSFQVRVPRGAVTGKVMVAGVGGSDEADFEVEQLTPSQAIAVFPNPSTGNFTVDFSRADFKVQAVQVFDTTGKLIYSEALNAGQSEQLKIALSGKKAGVFLVNVQTERGKVVKKVTLL